MGSLSGKGYGPFSSYDFVENIEGLPDEVFDNDEEVEDNGDITE